MSAAEYIEAARKHALDDLGVAPDRVEHAVPGILAAWLQYKDGVMQDVGAKLNDLGIELFVKSTG